MEGIKVEVLVVTIGKVRPMSGWKKVKRRVVSPQGAATSLAAITAVAIVTTKVVVDCLEM